MSVAVVTVAAGGLPVIDVTATKPALGLPVTEAVNGRGIPVTKVSLAVGGLPVTFVLAGNEWPSGGGGGGTTYTTWNPADRQNVALSNGDLTATTTNSSNPVGIRGIAGKSTGQYYWEATMTTWNGSGAAIGLGTASATLFGGSNTGTAIVTKAFNAFGGIEVNGSYTGSALGTRANGDIIGVAVDLTARLIWFRVAPSGNWNGSGTANPATATGGISIAALSGALFPYFAAAANPEVATANFGASTFSGAVPAGFTSGWGT